MALSFPLGRSLLRFSVDGANSPSTSHDQVPVEDLYATLTSWLHTLGRLGSDLDRFDDLGEFLEHIAACTASMLGYDFAMVLTMDDNEVLHSAGSYGLTSEYVRNVWIPPARAGLHPWTPVREAYRTGEPAMVSDVHREPRLQYFHAVFRRQGVRSYACFPLRSPDGCQGVLTVYRRTPHEFSALEVNLMSALAGFAASAVRTARLRQERDAQIAQQQVLLRYRERSEDIHDTLMRVVLSRQGLGGIVTALAELLEGAVLIEDTVGRILALANRDEGREDVRRLVRAAASQQVGVSRAAVEGLHYAPVVVDGAEVAMIRAMVGPRLDGVLVRQALGHGAVAAALHLLGEQVQQQGRQRTDAELLNELEALRPGEMLDDLLARTERLGYRMRGRIGILLVGSPTRTAHEVRSTLLAALRARLTGAVRGAFVGARGTGLAVILPRDGDRGDPEIGDVARDLAGTISQIDHSGEVRVVIAGDCPGVDRVAEYLEFADGLLRLAGADRPPRRTTARTIDGRKLGIYRVLASSTETARLAELRAQILGPLLAYDHKHRGDLVRTLDCFLRNGMRVKETARELVIHVNSLAYRLRRAEEILGLEVRNADDMVQVQFAIQLDAVLRDRDRRD
jgi:sugar diacid utilization regulator